jgi:hypothetical protein
MSSNINEELTLELILMHSGDELKHPERFTEDELLSHGLIFFESEKAWIKVYR